MKAQIKGMGHALPERILDNKELEQMVETSEKWIIERTGIRERRIIDDSETTSDLAYRAALMAVENARISVEELDLIIVATASPDMIFPSTACMVQEKLGAWNAAAFDILAGCTGFVYGITVAEKFLLSPECNYVLVIGAEALSRIIDYTDSTTCVLFGDGAGAAVLGRGDSEAGIIASYLGADGRGGKHLYVPAGCASQPASHETVENHLHFLKMNGNEIFRFATKITVEISEKIFAMTGVKAEDIDLFIPHQSNMRIIRTAMKWMKIPAEKTIVNVDQYGNMSAACLPVGLSLAAQEGQLKAGDLVLMVSFGAGLTYGGVLLRWGSE
ncbi:3-oxoacyl-acp synthase, kasiii [hydrocarbon metagenome]|uniref:beta-ketoacyl-[acyl-carrier-protein] synthase III n=1 Tax=hydrocarbon metagenome TaxID=938273 RepID=A0A0W8E622_9ZZZZ